VPRRTGHTEASGPPLMIRLKIGENSTAGAFQQKVARRELLQDNNQRKLCSARSTVNGQGTRSTVNGQATRSTVR